MSIGQPTGEERKLSRGATSISTRSSSTGGRRQGSFSEPSATIEVLCPGKQQKLCASGGEEGRGQY